MLLIGWANLGHYHPDLVVTRHQYGISALVSQTSLHGETSDGGGECRLFSQVILHRAQRRSAPAPSPLNQTSHYVVLRILPEGVPPACSNPEPISDPKMSLFTPVFRPGVLRHYVIIT